MGQWQLTPLVPTLGRQRQKDLSEFEAGLVYRGNSRTARDIKRNPFLTLGHSQLLVTSVPRHLKPLPHVAYIYTDILENKIRQVLSLILALGK